MVIVFSGRSAKNFNLYKIIEKVNINKLFIRDPAGRTWYNSELECEGGWNDIDGMIERIRSYVDRFNIEKVYVTGGSMGGYAALVTAFKLGIKKCLIFSPQIELDFRFPNNPSKDIPVKYKNAFELYKSAPGLSIKIIIGSDEISDVYNVINVLKFKEVEAICIKSAPHNALFFLSKNGLLFSILVDFLHDREMSVVLPLFDFFRNKLFVDFVKKITEGFYHEAFSFDEIVGFIDSASEKAPFWACLPYMRGRLFERFGKDEDAVKYYERAISLSPENSLFRLDFGSLLIKLGKHNTAELEFLAAIKYSESENSLFYFKIGVSCLLQKKYEDAFYWQKKAININKKYSPSYYQLGLIENIRGNYESALSFFNEALRLKDKNPNLIKHINTAKSNLIRL